MSLAKVSISEPLSEADASEGFYVETLMGGPTSRKTIERGKRVSDRLQYKEQRTRAFFLAVASCCTSISF